jgi:hypothetical protein
MTENETVIGLTYTVSVEGDNASASVTQKHYENVDNFWDLTAQEKWDTLDKLIHKYEDTSSEEMGIKVRGEWRKTRSGRQYDYNSYSAMCEVDNGSTKITKFRSNIRSKFWTYEIQIKDQNFNRVYEESWEVPVEQNLKEVV